MLELARQGLIETFCADAANHVIDDDLLGCHPIKTLSKIGIRPAKLSLFAEPIFRDPFAEAHSNQARSVLDGWDGRTKSLAVLLGTTLARLADYIGISLAERFLAATGSFLRAELIESQPIGQFNQFSSK